MAVSLLLATLASVLVSAVTAWVFQPALVARRTRRGVPHPCESRFRSADGHDDLPCPSVHDPATRFLTVVVPAYNEEERLPLMIEPTLAFLHAKAKKDSSFTFEVIVVDDGSSDDTAGLVLRYTAQHGLDCVRLLQLRPNQGKGAAIRKGVLRARGQYVLMADADGATEIADLDPLLAKLQQHQQPSANGGAPRGVGIGSRAHLEKESVAKRAFYRTVLMWGMHVCVTLLCSSEIQDTQCGFKLFTRHSAAELFENLHLERWAFDIELVQLCARLRIPMVEVAVRWQEIDGSKLITSKLDVVTTSLTMLRDMLCVRLCYSLGIWRVKPTPNQAATGKSD